MPRRIASLLLFVAGAGASASGAVACSAKHDATGNALGAVGEGGAGHFRDAQAMGLDASLTVNEAGDDEDAALDDAGEPDDAEPDDAAPPEDAGGDATDAHVDPPDAGPAICTKTLTIATLSISPSGCPLNEDVTAAPATLTYPCAGGTGTVTLGFQTFTGTVASGQIGLENIDTFVLGGVCTWQSTQRLEGNLSGPLVYSYSEKVVTSGCSGSGACKGSGSCSVK